MTTGSIYHYSANSSSCVCEKHTQELIQFATENDIEVKKIYIDSSLKKGEQGQYKKMLGEMQAGQTLIIRDIAHFNRWTNKAFTDILMLLRKEVKVISQLAGEIVITDGSELYNKPLKCAFYHSKLSYKDERCFETQKQIAELFCSEKTNWDLCASFSDENCKGKTDLKNLIKNAGKYDLIITGSFSRIDLTTAKFMKLRSEINRGIYSLKEGLLYERKED